MPKTRKNQMLLRAAIQAEYLRTVKPPEPPVRLPPPAADKPAPRDVQPLR